MEYTDPPLIITFVAPAERCNQRCPACIIDRSGEPVRQAVLQPDDYASIVGELVSERVPIFSVSFQGYEVTLPGSWPYLEKVFSVAREHGIRRSFITNGMLLHKYVNRIEALAPHRIAVSLDAADESINDRLRGLPGAFHATLRSIERCVAESPQMAERMTVSSTLYDGENARSLRRMPKLLRRLGIPRWTVTFELEVRYGRQRPAQSRQQLVNWLIPLRDASEREDIAFHTNDELGFFGDDSGETAAVIEAKHLFDPDFLIRVDPSGHVRLGKEVTRAFEPNAGQRYAPGQGRLIDQIGYRERVARYRAAWHSSHADSLGRG